MERLIPAQSSEPSKEITCFQYFSSKGPKNDCLKLCDLSRNVLIVLCEYLSFFQIVMLTTSNKRIKTKLDNFLEPSHEVSYFKRRAIINFQSFFFEQFPCTEVFFKRMSSITSCSTMASTSTSSFLPLTKQSSLCIQSTKTLPIFSKQLSSCNPFEMAMEAEFSRECRKQLLEKIDDNKTSNYIDETYRKWRDLYLEVLENKQKFVNQSKNEFYSAFVQEPEEFAREIFLDPSLCENPTFALPQLTRETFTQKGLFYRTEKILVQGFHNCFTKHSVDYTKQVLWEVNQDMQQRYQESEGFRTLIASLVHGNKQQISSQYEYGLSHSTTMTNVTSQLRSSSAQFPQNSSQDEDYCCNKSRSEVLNNLMPDHDRFLIKAKQSSISPFECCLSTHKVPQTAIIELYYNISSYALRQFQLLCNAHNQQLDFILQQINMAPPQKQNFYIYLEDYIVKEKNLRFLLKKVSHNFVIQESFSETLIKSKIVSQNELNKHPYYCDFILLELMDSIWMNETYRKQRENLLYVIKKEITAVHQIDRIDELIEKKETLRKIINLIHQMEFNLENETKSDNQGISAEKYKDLEAHLCKTVRYMLKHMQRSSHTVNEFIQHCHQYESYEFTKIQELEYFYIVTKKHYLSKAFCKEFSTRLENNKFQKSFPDSGSSSPLVSKKNAFLDLNLNQIIPCELINSFFHQLIRNLMKEVKFKEFMECDQFMQSLFVLFHIDQHSKNQFTHDLNHYMVQYHQELDNLRRQFPHLYGEELFSEEKKQSEMASAKLGYSVLQNNCQSGPFTLIDEDDDFIEPIMTPELNRGYSDQKRQYQKAFRGIVFEVFQLTEEGFDFKNMIEKMRQEEHKRMVDQLQAQINNFNQTIQQRGNQQNNNVQVLQTQQQNLHATQSQPLPSTPQIQPASLQPLPDLFLDDLDDEDLPDPSMLMATFNTEPRQQSQSLTNEMTFNNNMLIGPGMGGMSNLDFGNFNQFSNDQHDYNSDFGMNFQFNPSQHNKQNSKIESTNSML